MLVNVRPSNEALLRARVPGAQDQRGCPSHPFYRARSVSKKGTWPLPSHPSQGAPGEKHRTPLHHTIQACSLSLRDGGWLIFHCARPTRGVRDRALREQKDHRSPFPPLFREQ